MHLAKFGGSSTTRGGIVSVSLIISSAQSIVACASFVTIAERMHGAAAGERKSASKNVTDWQQGTSH